MTDGFGRLAVDCASPVPSRDGLVINHRARDPHDQIVWDRAGKVLNDLCFTGREPVADLGRRAGDFAYSREHGGRLQVAAIKPPVISLAGFLVGFADLESHKADPPLRVGIDKAGRLVEVVSPTGIHRGSEVL